MSTGAASGTANIAGVAPGAGVRAAGTQAPVIRTVSFLDSLLYTVLQVVPSYTQGLFTRNASWVSFWARVHPDPLGVRLLSSWKRKYGAELLYVSMLGSKSLLVLEPAGIRRALDNSPHIYGDAKLKRKGMSHFQPDAVTISRGDAWRDRRRFNEAVLDAGTSSAEYTTRFLSVIQSETARCLTDAGTVLRWQHIQDLFDRITLRVVFGDRARDDAALLGVLKALMRESNRVVGLKTSRHFNDLYSRVRAYLQSPEEGSLAALCAHVPATEETRIESQIPHWLFAMDETLAANTARALALISAHRESEVRVRREMGDVDLSTPEGIQALTYLEGCIYESMRLWPTTPLLARELLTEDTMGGTTIPAGTQVLIPSGFLHRDPEAVPHANTFSPEAWASGASGSGGERDYRFNHFSNGSQVCPGEPLALFVAKAVLASLLSGNRYTLRRPQLDVTRPLPHAYDYFKLVLSREDLHG